VNLVDAVAGAQTACSDRSADRASTESRGYRSVCRPQQVIGAITDSVAHLRPTSVQADRLDREKRVLLSRTEESAINETIRRLAAAGAPSLTLSHLLRACMILLRQVEEPLTAHFLSITTLVRPPNGNARAVAEYECALALLLASAVRSAPCAGSPHAATGTHDASSQHWQSSCGQSSSLNPTSATACMPSRAKTFDRYDGRDLA